jgi:hypothetical protein
MTVAPEVTVTGVAPVIATELQKIWTKGGGRLEAAEVVKAARAPSSPLHTYFEWDDKKAAAAHRIGQARDLIRRVQIDVIVEPGSEPIRVRAYVAERDVTGAAVPGAYLDTTATFGSADAEALWLAQIERDVTALRRKYATVRHLLEAVLGSE